MKHHELHHLDAGKLPRTVTSSTFSSLKIGNDEFSQHSRTSSEDELQRSNMRPEHGILSRLGLEKHSYSDSSITLLVRRSVRPAHTNAEISSHRHLIWLPFCLRLPYLVSLAIFAFALGVTVIALTSYSVTNTGLGPDAGSAGLLFGWRFTPTLIAVIYTISVTAVLTDVRRTEVFARLSRGSFVSADHTLCLPSRFLWNDPFDAWSKAKNSGCRSWALLFASIVNILGILVISPLSAAFLAPLDLAIVQDVPFQRFDSRQAVSFSSHNFDEIAFRTTTGAVLNTSASIWVDSDYFVLPFAPRQHAVIPTTSSLAPGAVSQQWQYQTIAYRVDMNCQELSLIGLHNTSALEVGANSTKVIPGANTDWRMVTQMLGSPDGCMINVSSMVPNLTVAGRLNVGGGWWAKSASIADLGKVIRGTTPSDLDASVTLMTRSGSCWNGSFITSNTPWTLDRGFDMSGYLCSTRYLQANVLATVSVTTSETSVNVDRAEFDNNQREVTADTFNITGLEDNFFTNDWSRKIPANIGLGAGVQPAYSGPIRSLSMNPAYRNSPNKLMNSSTLLDGARALLQNYMGYMMLASLNQSHPATDATADGQILFLQRRIAVTVGAGITIGTLLVLSSIGIVLVAFFTRISRRPLGLQHDPASIAASTSLLVENANCRHAFASTDDQDNDTISEQLRRFRFRINHGNLQAEPDPLFPISVDGFDKNSCDSPPLIREVKPWTSASSRPDKSVRPPALRTWNGPSLLSLLLFIIGALIALYVLANRGGLQQRVLTFQVNLKISTSITTFAPYSIVPTLIAVGVKLWFGAVEEGVKRLTPIVSMARVSQPTSNSLLCEYANAPVFFSSIKAARASHLMVVIIGLAALSSEIFTVSMSALWLLESRTRVTTIEITRQLELRSVPFVYQTRPRGPGVRQDPIRPNILGSVYGNGLSSWLYSAVIELTQSGATPAWSRDTWSFVPLDFDSANISTASQDGPDLRSQSQTPNVTLHTVAIRARLECEALPYVSNASLWMNSYDLYNSTLDRNNQTLWNDTNRPVGLDTAYELKTSLNVPDSSWETQAPMGPSIGTVICCSNVTDDVPGEAALGYWSQIGGGYTSNTMLAKWVVGHPLDGLYNDSRQPYVASSSDVAQYRHWLWASRPQLQAINCTAHIEQANASVTIDTSTGAVLNYTILDEPQNATQAWSDPYISHAQSASYKGQFPSNSTLPDLNTTTSFGFLFFDSLLNAASIGSLGSEEAAFSYLMQDEKDRAFNFRDRGINVDYMSYSILSLVNGSKTALLNATTLIDTANHVFGTFFKHFASKNVSSTTGGYVYQPIGAKLPADLGAPYLSASKSGFNTTNPPLFNTSSITTATLSIPTSTLIMSPAAVFICIILLIYIAVNVIIIFGFWVKRIDVLPRDIENLASMLGFVYGSKRLLEWVAARKEADDWETKGIGADEMVALGEFDKANDLADGTGKGWGVELVNSKEGG